MMTITVVGGGNSAHVLIPLLSETGMNINLLTRKPDVWKKTIDLDYVRPSGEFVRSFQGEINKISSDPADVIPDADIIILCLPVHIYRQQIHSIAPYIKKDKEVYIGTVFGQGGINWMTGEIRDEFGLPNIRTFAFGLIPWICRTEVYGEKGIVYGAKPINIAAVEPRESFDFLNKILFKKVVFDWFGHGAFRQADNFLSLTMSVDNQILHTSRMYGLHLESGGEWEKMDDIPFFYSEFSELSARILKGLDSDYSLIRRKIRKRFPDKKFTYMMSYIEQDNMTNIKNNKTYLDTLNNSEILVKIKPPVIEKNGKWVLDTQHRFLTDDVFYGLCVAKSIAQMLKVRTYHIDKTLTWAQKVMGERIINKHKLSIAEEIKKDKFKYGIPQSYGIEKIEDLYS